MTIAGQRRRRAVGRVGLVVLAVVAGLAIAMAIDIARNGGVRPWLARHHLPPPYVAGGERVTVGAGAFYLDCRGSGSPTLVLEAGAGNGAGGWSSVSDELAETTRTCAYDRAGIGQSDPRGHRTLADAASDLRALLAAAGEQPPFVVVAHSLGGAYARVFAAAHRDVTGAIVLLDTFDPDLQADRIHPLLGSLKAEYDRGLQDLRDIVAAAEDLDWPASERQLREADLRGLRIATLVAPRFEPRLDEAANERIRLAWEQAFEDLSPGRVTYEYANGAGHNVHVDRPDLVLAMVRRIVAEVRGSP